MFANESHYLALYRKLVGKRDAAKTAIADLHALCALLKDWQKTAESLEGPNARHDHPEWAPERLRELASLRALLSEYHLARQMTQGAWDQLPNDDRRGLADPSTLDVPA